MRSKSSHGKLAHERRSLLLCALLPLALALTPAQAVSQPGQATPGPNPGQGSGQGQNQDKIRVDGESVIFAVDEENGIPFLQFVKFAQKFTGKKFFIDRQQAPAIDPVTAQTDKSMWINLLGQLTIKKKDFYSFFQTILFIKGWVCVPRGTGDSEFVDLIWQQGPRSQDIKKGVVWVPPDDLANYASQTGTYIVTTVKLKYVNAQLATANLRTFFNDPRGLETLIPIGGQDQRSMMISGFGPSVFTIYQLLKVVDVEEERPKGILRVIDLENGAVEDIQPILDQILTEQQRGAPAAASPQGGGVTPDEDKVPVKILTNANTNSLIVFAHENKVREIENMVAKLDVKPSKIDSNFHVYRLVHTLAKDMREVLSDFIQQATQAQTQTQTGGTGQTGGTARREQRPVIKEDEKGNALLISASRSQYEKIVDLIRSLDQKQDQVLIEAALIELGTQDIERLGVELGLIDIGGNEFTRPFGLTSFGLSTFQDTDGNDLPDTRLPDFENPLRGLTGGILSSDDFAIPIILNALKSDTQSNVLSIPSVLVANNENATIRSLDSFPTTRITSGNVTTDQSFQGFQDAGIDLRISPSISEGNYVKLNLRLEVSQFTGQFDSNAGVPPPKTTRVVETVVTLPSGHTMVFGGVIQDTVNETNEGIPFLKDLPLIGALFRNKETTNRKTNFYFFLTPHILSDPDFADLSQLTFRKKLEAAEYIGHRRIKVVDPNWRGQETTRLEDSASTVEDIDRLGGFNIPTFQTPPGGEVTPKANEPGGSSGAPRLPGNELKSTPKK